MRWGGVNSLPFWSLIPSSDTVTSNMPFFWFWAMRNQLLWTHLSLSMFRESRERSRKSHYSRDSLIHWVHEWRFPLICQLANQLQIFIRFSFRFFPIMGWFKKYVAVRGQKGILPLSWQTVEGWMGKSVKLRPVRNVKKKKRKISTTNISIHLIIDFNCIKLFSACAISPSMISF